MLKNSRTVLQRHGGNLYSLCLPLLIQRQMTAAVAGRHHLSGIASATSRALRHQGPDQSAHGYAAAFFRHTVFAQKLPETRAPAAAP